MTNRLIEYRGSAANIKLRITQRYLEYICKTTTRNSSRTISSDSKNTKYPNRQSCERRERDLQAFRGKTITGHRNYTDLEFRPFKNYVESPINNALIPGLIGDLRISRKHLWINAVFTEDALLRCFISEQVTSLHPAEVRQTVIFLPSFIYVTGQTHMLTSVYIHCLAGYVLRSSVYHHFARLELEYGCSDQPRCSATT